MLPVQSVSIHAIRLPLIILQYNLLVQTDNVLASHDCVKQFMNVDCCKQEPHIRHIQKHIERSRHVNNEYTTGGKWIMLILWFELGTGLAGKWRRAGCRSSSFALDQWWSMWVLELRPANIDFVLFCSSPYWKKMLAFRMLMLSDAVVPVQQSLLSMKRPVWPTSGWWPWKTH